MNRGTPPAQPDTRPDALFLLAAGVVTALDRGPEYTTMTDYGDRVLTLVGIALVLFIAFAAVVGILAGMNAPPDTASGAPDVNWTIQRTDTTHVAIVHDGGDPVDTDELFVTVDGLERRVTWSGRLTTGEGGIVRAREGQRIRLYWHGGRGDDVMLDNWNV